MQIAVQDQFLPPIIQNCSEYYPFLLSCFLLILTTQSVILVFFFASSIFFLHLGIALQLALKWENSCKKNLMLAFVLFCFIPHFYSIPLSFSDVLISFCGGEKLNIGTLYIISHVISVSNSCRESGGICIWDIRVGWGLVELLGVIFWRYIIIAPGHPFPNLFR